MYIIVLHVCICMCKYIYVYAYIIKALVQYSIVYINIGILTNRCRYDYYMV